MNKENITILPVLYVTSAKQAIKNNPTGIRISVLKKGNVLVFESLKVRYLKK